MQTSRRALASAFAATIGGFVFGAARAKADTRNTKSASVKIGRRVVTGFNEAGKSIIAQDAPAPRAAVYDFPGDASGFQAWSLAPVPADLSNFSDPMVNGYHQNAPPRGGVVARVTTWYPGSGYPMHTTETIDFGIVLSGRLELGLEDGSTILEPGDFVVQRNTPHSWKVVGDQPCTVAFVLIDGKNAVRKAHDPS
jgi:quercetin dioxygenase-like cupin family protein